MKKILASLSLFLSLQAAAQTVDTVNKVTTYEIIKVIQQKTPAIRIDNAGNFFFWPATFCDCDKCQAIKGWKFLYNIYKKD